MLRVALWIGLFAGCSFDGGYGGATVTCSDGRCPTGLVCHEGTCVTSIPIDMAPDMMFDAPPAMLTCDDPGPFPATGGTTSGTTTGATSKVAAICPTGVVNNGPDRVYRIPMDGTRSLRVTITGMRKAYVLAACDPSPATPACLGGARAIAGTPLVVTPPMGNAWVIVDDENAAAQGTYTLTLTVQ